MWWTWEKDENKQKEEAVDQAHLKTHILMPKSSLNSFNSKVMFYEKA